MGIFILFINNLILIFSISFVSLYPFLTIPPFFLLPLSLLLVKPISDMIHVLYELTKGLYIFKQFSLTET